MTILIVYASVDGHTEKICKFIAQNFVTSGYLVNCFPIGEWQGDLNDYDHIILASSIRYGIHNTKIIQLANENATILNSKRTAFISVNLVARKAEKSSADTNPYMLKFLAESQWSPSILTVFAGKLHYDLYSFKDRFMIRLIMLITKGPLRTKKPLEFTDWSKVKDFSNNFFKIPIT